MLESFIKSELKMYSLNSLNTKNCLFVKSIGRQRNMVNTNLFRLISAAIFYNEFWHRIG